MVNQVLAHRIPRSLFLIDETNLLDAMLFPLTKSYFMDMIYAKKALVIRGQPEGRFKKIIEEQMFGLDIEALLIG